MKLVVCEPENIPPWIFPVALRDYPNPGTGIEFPGMDNDDFIALAKALDVEIALEDPFLWPSSECDVGFSHDAPDCVPQFRPEMLSALLAIPEYERWRVAESWAGLRFRKRPNKEELTLHKKLLKTLCEYAAMAVERGHIVVLIEPYA